MSHKANIIIIIRVISMWRIVYLMGDYRWVGQWSQEFITELMINKDSGQELRNIFTLKSNQEEYLRIP